MKKPRGGLPIDLWRDVNRAAYARAQASFREQRVRLVGEAAEMLRQGRTAEEVRKVLLAHALAG